MTKEKQCMKLAYAIGIMDAITVSHPELKQALDWASISIYDVLNPLMEEKPDEQSRQR